MKNKYTINGDRMKKLKPLIVSIGLPLLLGAISAFISNMDTYSEINKPFLSPPGIVFPIVWTILYILMGVSKYLISKENNNETASLIYYIQLIINVIWPLVFFNAREYLVALAIIIILIIFVITMIIEFRKLNKTAAYLQIPYLIWLLFATYLNYQVLILN